jgi:alkanesulfonate monooxygenase SsuD/methylene tetrahydromethanopterin reductase-like flavin-dependent oxidoreductase (luciferase family)
LLAGERVNAEGPYPMRRASLAVRNPRPAPPIHLAALNDAMLRLAGEVGEGGILNFISPSQTRRSVQIMKEARAAAGVNDPFEVSIYFRATVTDNPALALARYQQELLTYLLSPVYQTFFAQDGWGQLCQTTAELWAKGEREAALTGIPLDFITQRVLIGTPASIHGHLAAYAEAGMDTAFIMPVPIPGTDYAASCREMIEALAPPK